MSDQAERFEGLAWVRGARLSREWNGIKYKLGMSSRNVGSKHLSMNVAVVPPSGVAYAHIHVDFEVMLYILEGRVRHEYGPDLCYTVDHAAGAFVEHGFTRQPRDERAALLERDHAHAGAGADVGVAESPPLE